MDSSSKKVETDKMKQYIIENSSEIMELRRQVQIAYNRHMLQVKILNDRANADLEKALEQKYAEDSRRILIKEEERLKGELAKNRREKQWFAYQLQQQILDKKRTKAEEEVHSHRELKELEKRIQLEEEQEQREKERQCLEKVRLREEQMAFSNIQRMHREQERVQMLEIEKKLQEDVNRLALSDAKQVAERHKRIEEAEAKKQIIAAKLEESAKKRKEEEELAMRLMCAEREEKEQKKYEEELRANMVKRKSLKVNYDDITRSKLEEAALMRLEDRLFAENSKKEIEADVEREMKIEQEKRRVRTAVRIDNHRLMNLKTDRRKGEQIMEKNLDESFKIDEANRLKIVQEERLRLLRSMDKQLLQHLPRGCLDSEDLLNLNC